MIRGCRDLTFMKQLVLDEGVGEDTQLCNVARISVWHHMEEVLAMSCCWHPVLKGVVKVNV